ncbi:MAG: hypothetical protein V1816_16805 [Pseudomonadota bacterium]
MTYFEEYHAGSEIDAFCTKCRLVTNHRVVAMLDGVVKRVICLTCEGQHNFRPPPGQKKTGAPKIKRERKGVVRTMSAAGKAPLTDWVRLKESLPPEEEIIPYRLSDAFEEGQAIEHPKFGLGFVAKVLNNQKINVLFERELKTLVMNY